MTDAQHSASSRASAALWLACCLAWPSATACSHSAKGAGDRAHITWARCQCETALGEHTSQCALSITLFTYRIMTYDTTIACGTLGASGRLARAGVIALLWCAAGVLGPGELT